METVCNCSLLLGHQEEGGMKSQHGIFWSLIMDTRGDGRTLREKREREREREREKEHDHEISSELSCL